MLLDDALRQMWIPGLNAVSGKQTIAFKVWLKSGAYSVDPASTSEDVLLNLATLDGYLESISFDINRLFSGAIESVQSISEVERLPRSLAWLIIKIYYASFFSAQALLRTSGVSCTFLDIDEVLPLRRFARAHGMHDWARIPSGQYVCVMDSNAKSLRLIKENGLATHETLWREFSAYLQRTRRALAQGFLTMSYQNKVDEILLNLEAAITNGGRLRNGNWLSQMRNAVNYRQEFGVWHPHQTRHCVRDWQAKISNGLSRDCSEISLSEKDELVTYLNTCLLLNAMCRGTLVDMSRRCPKGKSFLSLGGVGLLSHLSSGPQP